MKTAMITAATMLSGLSVGYSMRSEPSVLFVFGLVLVVVAAAGGFAVQEDK